MVTEHPSTWLSRSPLRGPGQPHAQHPKESPIYPPTSVSAFPAGRQRGGNSFCVPDRPIQHPDHEAAANSSALAQHRPGLGQHAGSPQAPKLGILGESSRRSQQRVLLSAGQFTPSVVFASAQWAEVVDSCSACNPASAAAASAGTTAAGCCWLQGCFLQTQHLTLTELFSWIFRDHFPIYQGLKPLPLAYRFSNLY